jgi:hypothetical protein
MILAFDPYFVFAMQALLVGLAIYIFSLTKK